MSAGRRKLIRGLKFENFILSPFVWYIVCVKSFPGAKNFFRCHSPDFSEIDSFKESILTLRFKVFSGIVCRTCWPKIFSKPKLRTCFDTKFFFPSFDGWKVFSGCLTLRFDSWSFLWCWRKWFFSFFFFQAVLMKKFLLYQFCWFKIFFLFGLILMRWQYRWWKVRE